jgi:GntR family transcriptional regulator
MSPSRNGPRHAAIAAALREQIRDGSLPPGSPVPSEAQLSAHFGVSRGTVRHALGTLRSEGLIAGGRGRVPVVRGDVVQSFDELVSFTAWATELGHVPGARTLELTRRAAGAFLAERLELEPGDPVFSYTRVRLLDGQPVMVERTTFVERVGRLLLDIDLDGGSVYAQLAELGVVLAEAHSTIRAMAAGAEDSELLGTPRRSPLLEVERRAFDSDGVPLEWSSDRYRSDAVAITVRNQRATPGAGVLLHRSSSRD